MSENDKIVELIDRIRGRGSSGGDNSFQGRERAMNRLVRIGSPAVPYLIILLADDDPSVREHAARALGYIGDPAAMQALVDAVKDVYIRGASIRALEGMGAAAVPALIELSAREEESIRSPALSVLSMLGERAIPALRDVLTAAEAGPRAREAAGHAMSVIRKDRKCPFGGSRTMGVDCRYCERKHRRSD